MIVFALVSLAFSGWMGWTVFMSVREEAAESWPEYVYLAALAAGSLSGMVVAGKVLAFG